MWCARCNFIANHLYKNECIDWVYKLSKVIDHRIWDRMNKINGTLPNTCENQAWTSNHGVTLSSTMWWIVPILQTWVTKSVIFKLSKLVLCFCDECSHEELTILVELLQSTNWLYTILLSNHGHWNRFTLSFFF